MAIIREVTSKEAGVFFEDRETSVKKLSTEYIFPKMQISGITNPIDPRRISKETTSCLNASSIVKAGVIFSTTVGFCYLAKATKIFSSFDWGEENSKDTVDRNAMEIKNKESALNIKTNLETKNQVNDPFLNRISKIYRNKDSNVKFEEIKVEEFKDLLEVKKEKNKGMRRSSSRRSISVQNPIPDQNVTVGDFFELVIDGNNVFSSGYTVYLEATSIPNWLASSNPNPTFEGSYNTPGYAKGVAVSGNYAYVVGENTVLQIIDISNPSNPTFKGSYDTLDFSYGVALFGNYAYVANGDSGLLIIDIIDSINPIFKGSYNTPGRAWGVAILGNYSYVADGHSGLEIIDISDPSNPTFKGEYSGVSNVEGITLSGDYAYLAAQGSGLQIIDISDPSNPTFKGSYDTPDRAFDVAISGDYAYVADDQANLQIIDISNPSNPTFKSSYDTPNYSFGVAVSSNYAYVADGYSGLQIIDVSNPSNPTFKSSCDIPGHAQKVVLFENYAYIANYYEGLQIIAPNLDKVILSGTPNFVGAYSVDIRACNEIMECITDSFEIVVKNVDNTIDTTDTFSDTTDTIGDTIMETADTTIITSATDWNNYVAIGSLILAVCIICMSSFSILLIIGGGVLISRRNRNEILENDSDTKKEELQKINIDSKEKMVVDNKLPQRLEEQKDPIKVDEDEELDAIPYYRRD
jgi:hypothetical protein